MSLDPSLVDPPVPPLTPVESTSGPLPNAAGGGDHGRWSLSIFNSPPLLALAVYVLVGGALGMLRAGASFLTPFILSGFIVTLSLPAYRALKRRGFGRGVALLMMMGVILLVGLTLALLLWLSAQRLMQGVGTSAPGVQEAVAAFLAQWGRNAAEASGAAAARFVLSVATSVASSTVQLVVSIILAAFLLLEAPRFGQLLRTSMADLPFLGMMPLVMETAVQYFGIRLRINGMVGLLFGVFLILMGVDHALLWALLSILLGFVPYIGLLLASAPPVLLALAESGWVWALIVGVGLVLINFGVENVVTPALTGKTLSLSPAIVAFSFIFWVWLLGAVGALVAMPLTVLLMLTFSKYESTRWVAQIIGNR